MSERLKDFGLKAKETTTKVGGAISQVGRVVKDTAKTIAVATLDQTGSGSVGQEDVKILTEKGKTFAGKAADEAIKIAKEAKKSNIFKEAAAGAIVGAVIAIPVPLIGPVAGATIGGILGFYIHFRKSM